MSRINHDCAPNAAPGDHAGGIRLVARRAIEQGEEITMSYVPDQTLMRPSYLRGAALWSWFPACACRRCHAPHDDARRFLCPRRCLNPEP